MQPKMYNKECITLIITKQSLFFLHFRSYELKTEKAVPAKYKRDWLASFSLNIKSSSYRKQIEFLTFDIWDLTSSVGGLLGLFIGSSFLGIIFTTINAVGKTFSLFHETSTHVLESSTKNYKEDNKLNPNYNQPMKNSRTAW